MLIYKAVDCTFAYYSIRTIKVSSFCAAPKCMHYSQNYPQKIKIEM